MQVQPESFIGQLSEPVLWSDNEFGTTNKGTDGPYAVKYQFAVCGVRNKAEVNLALQTLSEFPKSYRVAPAFTHYPFFRCSPAMK